MNCPGCLSSNTEATNMKASSGYVFFSCNDCELVFANPMKAGTQQWYENSADYVPPIVPVLKLKWYEAAFFENINLPKKSKLLNVGCGKTVFLKELCNYDYQVHAVDISEKYVNFTREKLGIKNAYHSDIMDFVNSYKGEKFDCILFFEVLEHLESPGKFLKELHVLLKEDGCIILSVPNSNRIESLNTTWDRPPHHLTRWNKKSLTMVLKKNGYFIQRIKVASISAEDLMYTFGIYFGTEWLKKWIDNKKNTIALKLLYRVLFFIRVKSYNLLASILRLFIKEKGLNVFVQAKVINGKQ